MPTSFATGDRVIGVREYDDNRKIIGVAGTIIGIDIDGRYSVVFDEDIRGHQLEGRCDEGFGWHVDDACLDFAFDECQQLAPSMEYDEVMM